MTYSEAILTGLDLAFTIVGLFAQAALIGAAIGWTGRLVRRAVVRVVATIDRR